MRDREVERMMETADYKFLERLYMRRQVCRSIRDNETATRLSESHRVFVKSKFEENATFGHGLNF